MKDNFFFPLDCPDDIYEDYNEKLLTTYYHFLTATNSKNSNLKKQGTSEIHFVFQCNSFFVYF